MFAETILGELGSSSGSHKDAFEMDEAELEADSGASDRPSNQTPTSAARAQKAPIISIEPASASDP